MTNQAYDDKNADDYDSVTLRLTNALESIAKNSKLPATNAQVALLAGVSRNTVTNRKFPARRLKEIKKIRKEAAAASAKEKRDKEKELQKTIDGLSSEVVYWFAQYREANRDRGDFENQLKRARENADFYRSAYEKEKAKVRDLEAQVELMKELLRENK
ncbi:MAG: hypothetical protein LAT53_05360 [Idiomarina sp.]|nr:hypothetical protein [Idiomarina sp.]